MDERDPLEHVPDPSKRWQVMGVVRGNLGFVEILDNETKTGHVIDLLSALQVAADINMQIMHMLEQIGEDMDAIVDPAELDDNLDRWQHEIWKRGQN